MLQQYIEANSLPLKSGRVRRTVAEAGWPGQKGGRGPRSLRVIPLFSPVQITLNGTAAPLLQRPIVVVVVIDCEQFVSGIWNEFFCLVHFFRSDATRSASPTHCGSGPGRNSLKHGGLTERQTVTSQDGQSSMQWGSMLPMKALFYRPVDR